MLTKADKLRAGELQRRAAGYAAELGLPPAALACTSAQTGRGLRPVAHWLEAWLGLELRRADGEPHRL